MRWFNPTLQHFIHPSIQEAVNHLYVSSVIILDVKQAGEEIFIIDVKTLYDIRNI